MTPSPIALFVYNRLDHTTRTVDALRKNILASESELVIFSDGPKNEAAREAVAGVRTYIRTVSGFKSVRVVERPENWGLARSIISGVTEMVSTHGTVIVIEDDLVTSPYFLTYMNDGLALYENDSRVASIHGYVYPVKSTLPETFFLRGADCWGWATWKRAWDTFEQNGSKLLSGLKAHKLVRTFDLDGAYGFSGMLERQIAGTNNSWAIRWHASNFLQNKLTLYPGVSLVDNIGRDKSGTHAGNTRFKQDDLVEKKITVERIPLEENVLARQAIIDYLRKTAMPRSFFHRVIRKLFS